RAEERPAPPPVDAVLTGSAEAGRLSRWTGRHGKTPQGIERSAARRVRAAWKRPFDLGILISAALLLLPLWIVLAVLVPLAIRLDSPGPALYRQTRLGRGGRVFTMLKFRTMADGAENGTGPVWAARRDPRVTRAGRFLRRWHLDELPQAVNVARGEMSLVGPRPERPELAVRIEREIPGFAERLWVLPGIAGLAQARGAGHRDPERKLRCDLRYIETMGPWLDARLLAQCALRVLRRGARRRTRTGGDGIRRRCADGCIRSTVRHRMPSTG
ncbi:MAG: hypothetical protein F4244_00330, partial [Gammaproteobacteria bacterium]|nr:hypothetical protein [Gammaproteobacteria bacterium]